MHYNSLANPRNKISKKKALGSVWSLTSGAIPRLTCGGQSATTVTCEVWRGMALPPVIKHTLNLFERADSECFDSTIEV
jgi:hypothetical protein